MTKGRSMRILLTRIRIGAQTPSYSYRVYAPFTEISFERQGLISMHSDFGHGAGLLARFPDVIAPMTHLEASPGLEKHRIGRLIDAVADRVAAVLLGAAFPEMTERSAPFRFDVPAAPTDARLFGTVDNLSGRYELLASGLEALTPTSLGFRSEDDR